jgi:hypothetical protein
MVAVIEVYSYAHRADYPTCERKDQPASFFDVPYKDAKAE